MSSQKRSISLDVEPLLVTLEKNNPNVRDICIDKSQFTIGRARESDETIPSVLISRHHAVFAQDKSGDWTISDVSSTVTYLNNIPLDRGVPATLSHGDLIQFSQAPEFKFVFTLSAKLNQAKRLCVDQSLLDTVLTQQKEFAASQESKRKELEEKLQTKQSEQNELRVQLEKLLKNQELAHDETQGLNKQIADLQNQIKTGNDAEIQLQQMYGHLMSTLEQERVKFEERLNEERRKWQEALYLSKQEKETVEKNMREQIENWRQQQQAEWAVVMEKLVQQEKITQQQLLSEKTQLEQKLKETEDALKEKSAIAEELRSNAENTRQLPGADPNPMAPQCIYVQLLNDGTPDQLEILETIDLTADELPSPASTSCKDSGVLTKVGDIMDEQLTCSVCSELFVKAVTLNCMHSFCHHCIISWMKKKRECPVCRATILAVNRSIVLDNFIEEMVANLAPEHRDRRKQLLEERKAAEQPLVRIKVKRR